MKLNIEQIGHEIVSGSIYVHKELGPGLLESVYHSCLMEELAFRRIATEKEVVIPIFYRGNLIKKDLRIDILVENQVIIEVKAVEAIAPVHFAQILSYLKLAVKKLGYLLNFNVPVMKDGIRRVINGAL